jgi:hypothetical protein
MSRRVRREALEHHRSRIQQLVACVSAGVVSIGRYAQTPAVDVRSLQLNGGKRASLSGSPLTLRLVQQLLVQQHVTSAEMVVTGYGYTVEHPDEGEVVSFQWHPGDDEGIEFPHLHIGPAMSRRDSAVRPGRAHRIHLPTGEVALADVVRLAIVEFGVVPRRDDWEDVLSRPGGSR